MRICEGGIGIGRGQGACKGVADLDGIITRVEDNLVCGTCAIQKRQKGIGLITSILRIFD